MTRVLLASVLLAAPAFAGARPPVVDAEVDLPATGIAVEAMDDGTGVEAVLSLQAFRLAKPMDYDHRAEKPKVGAGSVLVVRVRPDLAQPKAVSSPVLYVGTTPALVLARDVGAACVVVAVPAGLDPKVEPVGFGSPELPERVDARRGAAERAALIAAGVVPRPTDEVDAATVATTLDLPDGDALYAHGADALTHCHTPAPVAN